MNLVWRISKAAPSGELVDLDAVIPIFGPTDQPEVSDGGWVASSFELLNGTEIHEVRDTVTGDLFDELFAPDATTARSQATVEHDNKPTK